MHFGLQGLTKSMKRFKTLNYVELGCTYPFRTNTPKRFHVAVIFSVLLPTVLLSHFSDRSERCFEACQEKLAECVSSSNSKSED